MIGGRHAYATNSLSWSAAYPRPLNCAVAPPHPLGSDGAFQTPCHESGFYAVTGAE